MRRIIRRVEYNETDRIYMLIHNTIYTIFSLIESLLLIRILLKLFGANAQNRFVDFIYSLSDFFLRPFRNIFANVEIDNGMILEINTIIAIIVYALITWIIIELFVNLTDRGSHDRIINMD